MKKLQKNIVLLLVIFLGCLNHNLNAQCVVGDFDVPTCITVNNPAFFLNTTDTSGPNSSIGGSNNSCSVDFTWEIYDANTFLPVPGSPVSSTNLNFTFPYAGDFEIYLYPTNVPPPGSGPNNPNQINNWCCPGGGGFASWMFSGYNLVTVINNNMFSV